MTHGKSAFVRGILALALVLGLGAIAGPAAHAQTFSVVHNFTGGLDGNEPMSGLVMAPSGNFYGTTSGGGEYSSGSVFELTPTGTLTTLYNFTGNADGGDPEAALVLVGGVLYGTTRQGGAHYSGAVFSLTLAGKETVIYSFGGAGDGATPNASLTRDASGNFYSTTFAGGAHGNGTVFKLTRPKAGSTAWTEQILYSFGAPDDGANPIAGVAIDKLGNLYGTTSAEGQYSYGNVYELVKSGTTYAEQILHQFELLSDGGTAYAGIVIDRNGDLFGGTTDGGLGGSNGGGTIFELTETNGTWSFTTIYSLPGWGVSGAFRNLLVESPNLIYGTTHCDGNNTAGTVFKLTESNGTWTYTSLHVFSGSDGQYLFSNPILDRTGDLYGTTQIGGQYGKGVAFKIALR